MRKRKEQNIARIVRLCCLTGALVAYSSSAFAVMTNTTLPSGFNRVYGDVTSVINQNIMNINQTSQNAVIKWDDFSIGTTATVNFSKNGGGAFNILNYVDSGNMSQIHGTMNAEGGNVYLVNTAGAFIGKSAQINVGSLYVSNMKMEDSQLKGFFDGGATPTISGTITNAELMNLGHIEADKVTFEGSRIVLDMDRLDNLSGGKLAESDIIIKTNDKDNVVLGYTAYDETDEYAGKDKTFTVQVQNDTGYVPETIEGYMWVENLDQLQAMNSNLSGNYALHNGIDATETEEKSFELIGSLGDKFTGKLDGLASGIEGVEFGIFDLNVTTNDLADGVGLFGYTEGATIKNLNMIGGKIVANNAENVGAVVGNATNTIIENVTNSMHVTGNKNVGGIVGSASGNDTTTMSGLVNTGNIQGHENVGGLAGSMTGGVLTGGSYNIGQIKGADKEGEYNVDKYSRNIGGLVGSASNATISNVANNLTVIGGYNVGGIVGNAASGTTIENAVNTGNITATGYIDEEYFYHTAFKEYQPDPNNKPDYWERLPDGTEIETDGQNEDLVKIWVHVANAGGIAGNVSGGSLKDVTNDGGNVNSTVEAGTDYYIAGNIGGIAGEVSGAEINNALNKENLIRGAHNVGGVAGYLTDGTIRASSNNGGDIMGTGARRTGNNGNEQFVQERIRNKNPEYFNIGNIGGIVGYMYGDAHVSQAGNRGDVHSQDIGDGKVLESAKAANVGGIAGKIDRGSDSRKTLEYIKQDASQAAVSDSYNTGDVQGYTGVGGVIGMMYNGEVAGSYNLGNVRSTRQADAHTANPLNMGGIVGDTTEETQARAVIYNVYNNGTIGDKEYTYNGRHVAGIVGRLSGTVEQSYNTGAIYNGSNVVGGIAGYFYAGTVNNTFNTGNITVVNKNNFTSQVGGIVGGVDLNGGPLTISNSYNLGTLRSFAAYIAGAKDHSNSLGGILGQLCNYGSPKRIDIRNVYTAGNLYAATENENGVYIKDSEQQHINRIVGRTRNFLRDDQTEEQRDLSSNLTVTNAYYIAPQNTTIFNNLSSSNRGNKQGIAIAFADRVNPGAYKKDDNEKFSFSTPIDGDAGVTDDTPWRIYDGQTTPILNAFLPQSEKYFSENWNSNDIDTIQYGTAYNPLLTIINAKQDLTYDWTKLGAEKNASFAVYNAGLELTNFGNNGNYYGGTLYSDGALVINDVSDNDIKLGSASKLYGSSVTINSHDNPLTVYGAITATGNEERGDVDLTGASVEIIGTVTSAQANGETTIAGINDSAVSGTYTAAVNNPNTDMTDVGDLYAKTVTATNENGVVNITATEGNAEILFGVAETGKITAHGDLNVTAANNVYMDSDLDLGNADNRADLIVKADGEIVLDLSNIGKTTGDDTAGLHAFMHHFNSGSGNTISFATKEGGKADAIIAIDMWDAKEGAFNLNKHDADKTFGDELAKMSVKNGGEDAGTSLTNIWISDVDQLKGIQEYHEDNSGTNILSYNFALKNDIDANGLTGYKAIGGDKGFTGKFDGRGNNIIGLDVTAGENAYVGVFSKIGETGTVTDLSIISSNFEGASVGAVAGFNQGTIENVTTFGNRVVSVGNVKANTGIIDQTLPNSDRISAAGGIAGINDGTITGSKVGGVVIAGDAESTDPTVRIDSTAGGVAGFNTGTIENTISVTAVTSSDGDAKALGGIAGINLGEDAEINTVESLGIVNGSYEAENTYHLTKNVGGIVGVNFNGASIENAYNEAHVFGSNAVGGIVGYSGGETDGNGNYTGDKNTIKNVVNSGIVIGSSDGLQQTEKAEYTGGLVGNNNNTDISDARNTGTVNGEKYVGGMVGHNDENSTLTNIINDGAATITGEEYVGGIAGQNEGTINATESKLVNKGDIYGVQYVGGIAGKNTGTIANTINDINLYVNQDKVTVDYPAEYFGGVVGLNEGIITSATNEGSVIAEDASYVGGIAGKNSGTLDGMGNSNRGKVIGKSHVGGVVGLNESAITGTDFNEGKVEVTNEGTVIALNGGAGGIFGENKGALTNVEFTNKGEVHGNSGGGTDNDGTGGIIGVNSGTVTESSLKNEVGGVVTGINNVGGLIGFNKGNIIGGQGNDGNGFYYKYQIYNNGIIRTGTYTPGDSGEYKFNEAIGENVGGLVGLNAANVTAAYNTGAIYAAESKNVGGIAGNNRNSGRLDQVFNKVMTDDGNTAHVEGGTNVGGLVGLNEGLFGITNAYNAAKVSGETYVGNAVGHNMGKVENVFDVVNTEGKLIGNEPSSSAIPLNSYSVSADDENSTIVNHVKKEQVNEKDTYAFKDDTNVWKFYDGHQTPLLKVFLTKATYNGKVPNLTYNGQNQGVIADNKNITAADELKAYHNANELLQNLKNANAGTYLVYSDQIAKSGTGDTFNPNNLGYDIDQTYTINKAELAVILDAISRTYGSAAITNKGNDYYKDGKNAENFYHFVNENNYGYSIAADNLTNEMIGELMRNNIFTQTTDGAVNDLATGKTTKNAGEYKWSANFELTGELAKNYQFVNYDVKLELNAAGVSKVEKAELTINLNDVKHIYGNANADYGISGNVTLVNGDTGTLILKQDSDDPYYGDTAVDVSGDFDYTYGVGVDYQYGKDYNENNFTGVANFANNYEVTVVAGKSTVVARDVTVTVGDIYHNYGSKELVDGSTQSFTGQFDESDLTNAPNKDKIVAQLKSEINQSIQLGNLQDNALIDNDPNGKVTQNANADMQGNHIQGRDKYTWTGDITNTNSNFNVTNQGDKVSGDSYVKQVELVINTNNVDTTYGTAFDETKYGYVFGGGKGLVNGDNVDVLGDITYTNDAAIIGGGNRVTADVGKYDIKVNVGNNDTLDNYYVTIHKGDATVNQAILEVSLNDVVRTYGDVNATYAFALIGNLVNGDKGNIRLDTINDAALKNDTQTNDVDEYTWNATFTSDDIANLNKNYNITYDKAGKSTVNKAQLVINVDNVKTTYGTAFDESKYGYVIDANKGLVNGDNVDVLGDITYTNTAALDGIGGKWTQNANGDYTVSLNVGELTNYEVTVHAGTATVNKKDLTITLNDVKHIYGNANTTNDMKYGVKEHTDLVNGDTGKLVLNEDNAPYYGDTAVIKLNDGSGEFYYTNGVGGNYQYGAGYNENNFTGVDNFANNYNVTVEGGKSTVVARDVVFSGLDAYRNYGDKNIVGGEYVIKKEFDVSDVALENRDKIEKRLGSEIDKFISVDRNSRKDEAIDDVSTGKVTQDANADMQGNYLEDRNKYTWSIDINDSSGNFNVVNTEKQSTDKVVGNSYVKQVALHITADNQTISKGDNPNYTGSITGLTNGDSLTDYQFDTDKPDLTQKPGTHKGVIGVYIDGTYYALTTDGVPTDNFWQNYDITGTPGNLTVTDDHNYTFWEAEDKYAWTWDKKREERERKAEVHFVDGGMKI